MSAKDLPRQLGERSKNILRTAREIAGATGLRLHEVYVDFVEAAAISLSNAVDLAQRDAREQRYLQLMKRYARTQVERFPHMMGELVLALEEGEEEVLGTLFMACEFGDQWRGQFFTPYEVSLMMAKMQFGEVTAEEVAARGGFLTLCEPACGAGGMVLASAAALREQGLNPQQHLHVTAIDVSAVCVHMTYVQLALHHIPAVVLLGDSLSMEMRETWYTPAHVLGAWGGKLRQRGPIDTAQIMPVAASPNAEQAAQSMPTERRDSPQMKLF